MPASAGALIEAERHRVRTGAEEGVSYTELRGYATLGNGQEIVARKKGIQLGEGFDIARANGQADVPLPG